MTAQSSAETEEVSTLSRPPSRSELFSDRVFRAIAYSFTVAGIVLLAAIVFRIVTKAIPAMHDYGWKLLTSATWDVNANIFGIMPQIWGTLYSSCLALLLGGFFGVTIAIFLTQDFLPSKVELILKNIIELLAAIPSVVYGLWGIYVLIPLLRPIAGFLYDNFSWIPFFGTKLSGPGMFPSALVLAIMILPTVAAVSQDSFRAIPLKTKEAAFGMGTTRWEAILRVMVPTAFGGIFGALVLGFGRALGETMAVAMLIGNNNQISLSLFSPANTLAALLALNFPEAKAHEISVLMYAACVLMLITLAVNVIGAAIIGRTGPGAKK